MKKTQSKTDPKIYKKNPDMVTRKIDEETVLVPIFKSSDELNCIYTLNEQAAFVWDRFDGKNTLADIYRLVLTEFDTNEEQAQKELKELVTDLLSIKAIS